MMRIILATAGVAVVFFLISFPFTRLAAHLEKRLI